MSPDRKESPWAYDDDSDIRCPRCKSIRVVRVLNSWAFSRGYQVFECKGCGKKFYDKGYDSYSPMSSK